MSQATYAEQQSKGCLARLEAWAQSRRLTVDTTQRSVSLVVPGGSERMVTRHGNSPDEASWYLINTLSLLGVEVP